MKRVLFGGLIGSVIMFVWGAIYHMAIPISMSGLSPLPNEAFVLTALKASIPEPGLYFYPGADMSQPMTPEATAAWEAKLKAGPVGLILYNPTGSEPMSITQLLGELGADILAALIVAMIIANLPGSYMRRALMVASLGLFTWFTLSLSYLIWYRFPAGHIIAEGLDQVVGWTLVGLVLGKIIKPADA
jgi:hypothetical protein